MKLSGRTLKQRLYGISHLRDRLARVRYFRGHGVHSPYIYAIVRQVFMVRELKSADRNLYDALIAIESPKRRAIELQNLMTHCGYTHFAIDRLEPETQMVILTSELDRDKTIHMIEQAAERKITAVMARPYSCRERMALCRSIIERHSSTTVDNRGYLLIFNNHLPKQHFRL